MKYLFLILIVFSIFGCALHTESRETINGKTYIIKKNKCYTDFFGCEERVVDKKRIDNIPLKFDESYIKKD